MLKELLQQKKLLFMGRLASVDSGTKTIELGLF
jgi:hypothetical protein